MSNERSYVLLERCDEMPRCETSHVIYTSIKVDARDSVAPSTSTNIGPDPLLFPGFDSICKGQRREDGGRRRRKERERL